MSCLAIRATEWRISAVRSSELHMPLEALYWKLLLIIMYFQLYLSVTLLALISSKYAPKKQQQLKRLS